MPDARKEAAAKNVHFAAASGYAVILLQSIWRRASSFTLRLRSVFEPLLEGTERVNLGNLLLGD